VDRGGSGAAGGSTGSGAAAGAAAGGSGGAGASGGQGTGADGGASTTGTGTVTMPEGSFPCGSSTCLKATQYCLEESGGPCCGRPGYTCVDLPEVCQAAGADCACFDQAECPCGGPGSCAEQEGSGIGISCNGSYAAGLTFMCGYP